MLYAIGGNGTSAGMGQLGHSSVDLTLQGIWSCGLQALFELVFQVCECTVLPRSAIVFLHLLGVVLLALATGYQYIIQNCKH